MVDKEQKLVEVARSFSYKLNLGNYTTADFFCSEKAEVPEDEAESKSQELYNFCRQEVGRAVEEYKRSIVIPKKEPPSVIKTDKGWRAKSDVEEEEKEEIIYKEEETLNID
jgi:hypothetical protein